MSLQHQQGYAITTSVPVHYRRNQARGVPLVLLHQTPSSSLMYAALMTELSDVACIALDTPGFGNTPALLSENVTLEALAQSLAEALAALGVRECSLFGHHSGAALAVQLATSTPLNIQKLILSGAPLLTDEQKNKLRAGLAAIGVPQLDGSHLLKTWERIKGRTTAGDVGLIQREALAALQAGDYRWAYEAVFAQDFAGQLARIQCPTLVIGGELDSLRASAEPTHALLANSQLKILAGAGTYVCDEHPALMAALIREFVR